MEQQLLLRKENYFLYVMFNHAEEAVSLKCVTKILKRDHPTVSNCAVFSCGAAYYGSNS